MSRARRVLGLLIVLAGAAAYANGLPGAFLFDDRTNIVLNAGIRTLPPGEPVPVTLLRRPVVRWSFAVNYALGGLDPRGYRATNVAVHVLAALCLFGVVRRALVAGWGQRRALGVGFAAALLWVVHPLQTQSVTYISQRLEALVGLCMLGGLYALVRGAAARRPWPWYAAAVALGWVGMGTKELMLVAPGVWALYDRAVLAESWQALWRARWGVYMGVLPAAGLLVVAALPTVRSAEYALGFGLEWISPWAYLRTQPGVILHYLRLAVWPDRLCLDYGWPLAASVWEVAGPAVVVGGLVVASVVGWWWAPRLALLGLAFVLVLAPTSSVMPLLDAAAEHRMYLPLACVVVAAVVGAEALLGRVVARPRVRAVVGGVVLAGVALALGVRTAQRNLDYRDELGMWEDVVACAPDNPRGHRNLGGLLGKRGEHERAIAHLSRAVALEPRYTDARQNLADELRVAGKTDEALAEYLAVLALMPSNPQVHNNVANLLQAKNRVAEAFAHYEAAVRADPGYAVAWDNYGVAKVLADDYAGAVPLFERAIAADPTLSAAHLHLGLALEALGQTRAALGPLREALRLDPRSRGAMRGLVRIYAMATEVDVRNTTEAIRLAEQLTLGGTQGSSEDLTLLAIAYAYAGRFAEAVAAAERALAQAVNSGEDDERAEIERSLECYRQGRVCDDRSAREGAPSRWA